MAINNNAININAGFELGSKQPLDSRQYLTKEQMLNINENIMPDAYFCICKNDGNIYTYNKNNEIDPETGKFRQVNSDVTKLQYIVMPAITEENKNDVIQYIGDDETEYNKGSWYAAEETVLYSYSDGNNTVYLKDSIPSLTSNVYTSTGELISDFEIVEVDTENFAFTVGDGTTYSLIDNSQKLYNWKELVGSELKDAVRSMNYLDGKIWIGNREEYEELETAIKENNSITFLIYDDDLNVSIINDEIVGHDTTLSSAEIYSKFVLANTTALVNYYKKSETMTKAEILAMIGQTLNTKIVDSLPINDISENTIYLIADSGAYDQYMYISKSWIKIGTTNIDLSDYATKSELNTKQDELAFDNVPTENSSNPVTSDGIYKELSNKLTVVNNMPLSPVTSTTLLYIGETGIYQQGGIYIWSEAENKWILTGNASMELDDYATTFIGTRNAWNALTADEKHKYKLFDCTDDITGGETIISDTLADGDLNPVTSNVVYNNLAKLTTGTATAVSGVGGTCSWIRIGKIVIVTIRGLTSAVDIPSGGRIFTNLPQISGVGIHPILWATGNLIRILNGNGTGLDMGGEGLLANEIAWGSFAYVSV